MVSTDKSLPHTCSGDGQIGFVFTAALAAFYAGFVLLSAFAPEVLSRPVSIGSGLTWAFTYGFAVIGLGVVLTGVYVIRANLREKRGGSLTGFAEEETER